MCKRKREDETLSFLCLNFSSLIVTILIFNDYFFKFTHKHTTARKEDPIDAQEKFERHRRSEIENRWQKLAEWIRKQAGSKANQPDLCENTVVALKVCLRQGAIVMSSYKINTIQHSNSIIHLLDFAY